jgi:hypothetical protein
VHSACAARRDEYPSGVLRGYAKPCGVRLCIGLTGRYLNRAREAVVSLGYA